MATPVFQTVDELKQHVKNLVADIHGKHLPLVERAQQHCKATTANTTGKENADAMAEFIAEGRKLNITLTGSVDGYYDSSTNVPWSGASVGKLNLHAGVGECSWFGTNYAGESLFINFYTFDSSGVHSVGSFTGDPLHIDDNSGDGKFK